MFKARPTVPPLLTALPANLLSARSQASEAIRQVTPIDNPIIRTPSHQVDYLSHFDLTFELHRDGKRIKLELEPNHDILAEDAYVQYIGADGSLSQGEPIQRDEHKVFRGRALVGSGKGRWTPTGWGRITMRKDGPEPLFEGAFSVDNDKHHIELQSTYLSKKRPIDASIEQRANDYMVVYRDTDMIRFTHSELKRSLSSSSDGCSSDQLGFNADLTNSIFPDGVDQPDARWGYTSLNSLFGLSKRQSDTAGFSGNTGGVNLKTTIGDSAGCPKTKKVALIGVATDCEMTKSFSNTNSTPEAAAKDSIINMVNTASTLYEESFNVSIGLRNLTINEAECQPTGSSATPWNVDCDGGNMNWRLNEFSKWRSENPDDNAYWTLVTGCPTGSEVGVSWMGRLCSSELTTAGDNSVTGANVVVGSSGSTWQIFAHETGHTFGAVHDCVAQTCAQDLEDSSQCCPLTATTCNAGAKYIMNPYAESDMSTFSPCTIGNVCSAIGRNSINSGCLSDNHGVVTITGSQCGNGIVEAGEDCDCGGPESCGDDPCCDGSTCKFKNNAVCDDANDSCCIGCQYAPADTVCRPSTSECDFLEKCTGHTSACPDDQYKKDGTSCGASGAGLTCASGQCTSRDYQCRTVVGTLLNSNDTWACENTNAPSCSLVCGSHALPHSYGATTCIEMNQDYLDGTPCEAGGHCEAGQCKGASALGWIDQHKDIVIGVCVGVGSLIVLVLLYSIIGRCRLARARRRIGKAPPPAYPGYRGPPPIYPGYQGPPPPPQRPPPMNQWPGYGNAGYQNVPPPPARYG